MTLHLTRIYTRGGDKGQTSLTTGERVSKAHPRLATYGTADELNSQLGMLRTLCLASTQPERIRNSATQQLARLQNELFHAGSAMSRTDGSIGGALDEGSVRFLEETLDAMNAELPDLTSFVLPGGNELNAWAHMARTTCRRLERELVDCESQGHSIAPVVHAWVNRLSDWLFVYSRWLSLQTATPEFLWTPGASAPQSR